MVTYELTVSARPFHPGNPKLETTALVINGQIPAPTIKAKVGDILEVKVYNDLEKEDTIIHWHGVLLPNAQDGVAHLTTPPIKPKTFWTYRFPIRHAGTYWYHSHMGFQEQRGLYGALVFAPLSSSEDGAGQASDDEKDEVVVLSDWTTERPSRILANLKKEGDWYALKKKSVASWDKVFTHGFLAIWHRIHSAWTRMGPMDISDVGYDAFLINGKIESHLLARPGDTLRLRMINAGASTYFYVQMADLPMEIVSADGMDVVPFQVNRLKMAIAETYDVLVRLPLDRKHSYELRATSEDGTGFGSLFIGEGEKRPAPNIPKPNLFLPHAHGSHAGAHKNHPGHGRGGTRTEQAVSQTENGKASVLNKTDHARELQNNQHMHSHHKTYQKDKLSDDLLEKNPGSHGGHHHDKSHVQKGSHPHSQDGSIIDVLEDYAPLKSKSTTAFDKNRPRREVTLKLTGNMERFVWSFNNRNLLESDKILIRKGEVVKFILINETMMHHPIHLHGHFFRVLNGQGENSPLKHTVDVPAMDTVEIEFLASEEGDWFFHCHNLYHMKAGMSRVVSYENSSRHTRDIFFKLFFDRLFVKTELSVLSHFSEIDFRASNSSHAIELEGEYNYGTQYEAKILYEKTLTRFLDFYLGLELSRHPPDAGGVESDFQKEAFMLGIKYVLPLLVELDFRVDSTLHILAELESSLALTERIRWEGRINTDLELRTALSFEFTKNFLASLVYDSHFFLGAGVKLVF